MTNLIFFFLSNSWDYITKSQEVSTNSYKLLNKIVIYVCLPALALYFIPKIHWNNQLLFPGGLDWVCSSLFYCFLFRKKYGWSKKLTGCLILTAGLGIHHSLVFLLLKRYTVRKV
jgi:predicted permease